MRTSFIQSIFVVVNPNNFSNLALFLYYKKCTKDKYARLNIDTGGKSRTYDGTMHPFVPKPPSSTHSTLKNDIRPSFIHRDPIDLSEFIPWRYIQLFARDQDEADSLVPVHKSAKNDLQHHPVAPLNHRF